MNINRIWFLIIGSLPKYKCLWKIKFPAQMINAVDTDCMWHSFLFAPFWHAGKQPWWNERPVGPRPKATFLCSCSASQGKKQSQPVCTPNSASRAPTCTIGEEGSFQACDWPGTTCTVLGKTTQISLQLVIREATMLSCPQKITSLENASPNHSPECQPLVSHGALRGEDGWCCLVQGFPFPGL